MPVQKSASLQDILSYVKKRETLVANKTAIDAELWKNGIDMDTKKGRLQPFSDDEITHANEEEKERKRLFLFEKSLKEVKRHRPINSDKIEDKQYQLRGAVDKALLAQKTAESRQS